MADLFYISDEAYTFLCSKAIENNFIRPNAIRKSGVSKFLCRLSWRKFTDHRPESLQAHDEGLIARRRVPIWYADNGRRARLLDIDDDAIIQYMQTALAFKITMGARYRGGPHYRSPTSITGAVLEAVGLGFLVPHDWPTELGQPKSPLARASGE